MNGKVSQQAIILKASEGSTSDFENQPSLLKG